MRRRGRAILPTLGNRNSSGTAQDHHEDGHAPLQNVLGVQKELTVFAIVYNLIRLVILQSAQHQQMEVERISFLDALRWLGAPDSGVPLEGLYINPARPPRVELRVKKRRPKKFPFMSKPRHVLRQHVLQQPLELN